jgi:hypothetical protein
MKRNLIFLLVCVIYALLFWFKHTQWIRGLNSLLILYLFWERLGDNMDKILKDREEFMHERDEMI